MVKTDRQVDLHTNFHYKSVAGMDAISIIRGVAAEQTYIGKTTGYWLFYAVLSASMNCFVCFDRTQLENSFALSQLSWPNNEISTTN